MAKDLFLPKPKGLLLQCNSKEEMAKDIFFSNRESVAVNHPGRVQGTAVEYCWTYV